LESGSSPPLSVSEATNRLAKIAATEDGRTPDLIFNE